MAVPHDGEFWARVADELIRGEASAGSLLFIANERMSGMMPARDECQKNVNENSRVNERTV